MRAMDQAAIAQVQDILRGQFAAVPEPEVEHLAERLRNPLKYRFRTILFVADDLRGKVKGFALLQHAADLEFCFLDFLSAAPGKTGWGIGGALYERVREEAHSLGVIGVFFECLPEDPAFCQDAALLKQNRARLRFYERFGARPVVNTGYETPLKSEDRCAPHLVYDPLDQKRDLPCERARAVVRAILERKYGKACPPGYIDEVVNSFRDNPVLLREPRYASREPFSRKLPVKSIDRVIALVVTDRHAIHHVRERGYVESPVRVRSIIKGIEGMSIFDPIPPQHFSEKFIKDVHSVELVEYFKRVCARMEPGESVYPYVFPIRNATRPPKDLPIRAGYYCIDTFTPINRNAYTAAKRAVDCALTADQAILQGYKLAYALVRPPGHHAERRSFGGFCYFNSTAVAAQYLSRYGKVAVLDIDYHHGNGTQDAFYDRSDVLTLSIHGHPHVAYPYFTGFGDERGSGQGRGYNVNFPLPESIEPSTYRDTLGRALRRMGTFEPQFLLVALGLDTARNDPTGTWSLGPEDFRLNGQMIGSLGFPTVVVQEGGYRTRSMGIHARRFFEGLWEGMNRAPVPGGFRHRDISYSV
jgi:acetoin utilization deacetylase AcuC-like enzyme/GNAT superfamily N-acetyltransferase